MVLPMIRRQRTATPQAPRPATPGRRFRQASIGVLAAVAIAGAYMSWQSLYLAATTHLGYGSPLLHIRGTEVNLNGAVFSLLLDGLILGASLAYVSGVKGERPAGFEEWNVEKLSARFPAL